MAKSAQQVRSKMEERVRGAGKFLEEGMRAGEDPVKKALRDPEAHAKKMLDGLAEASRRGKIKEGLEKADKRGSWEKAIPKAARHFEDSAEQMVEHAMEDYDDRMSVVDAAKKAVEDMPTTTRDQRISKSAAYQKEAGKRFDSLYGRKG